VSPIAKRTLGNDSRRNWRISSRSLGDSLTTSTRADGAEEDAMVLLPWDERKPDDVMGFPSRLVRQPMILTCVASNAQSSPTTMPNATRIFLVVGQPLTRERPRGRRIDIPRRFE